MSVIEKKEFVIKHVFPNVMSMKASEYRDGGEEKHFNVPWRIKIYNYENYYITLKCLKFCGADEWSINVSVNIKLFKKTEEESLVQNLHFLQKKTYYPSMKIITPAEIENYLLDGNLTVEMNVKITKMTGIKEKLSNFDESIKPLSDVVLIVNDDKFHVSKNYLAYHSSYFKSLFSGNFDESKQSEIKLNDIDPYDFQNFLEVLHGEPAVDEDTIEGILLLADMYDSKTAIRRCEEFYLNKSEQSLKVKFDAAIKYKMDKLTKKCISEMKTADDIGGIMPEDPSQLDYAVWKEVLKKSLSLMRDDKKS